MDRDSESEGSLGAKPIELYPTDESRTQFGELTGYYPDPKTGEFRVVISSTWMLYVVLTGLVFLINVYFYHHYWNYLNRKVAYYGMGMYGISLLCSIKVFLCNPGIPNPRSQEVKQLDDNDKEYCEKCKVWLDNRRFYLHCRICGCCVEDFDDHSTFFGKCVGRGNYWSYTIYYVLNLLSFAFMVFVKGYNLK